jgi:hypothetical protein
VKKIKKEIEVVAGSLYESCDSYAQDHKYLEDYLHQQKGGQLIELSTLALAALKKKINILGYDDLTQKQQKQQEQARRLPKGIVDNIMSQMRLLRSATTISPTVGNGCIFGH